MRCRLEDLVHVWGKGTVAGPCHVTDNAEGTTHNEMRPLPPPPGMETTERMSCSGQDCGDKTFRDTPPRPSQVSTSVLSVAEMEKNIYMGRKNALPSPLPAFHGDGTWGQKPSLGTGTRKERKGPVGGGIQHRAPGLWEGSGGCTGRSETVPGFHILECLPGFKEAKSLGLIHIHFRLKVKDSQPVLISLSLAELCVQGSLAL